MNDRLLFLAQRLPYPPDKGEKIRAWHLVQHLAQRYEVHLGCFYDAPEDARHIPFLREMCASLCCLPLAPWQARLRSLRLLAGRDPLTLGYFADPRLSAWVGATLAAERPGRVFVFASSMAPYALSYRGGLRVLDMVDVDSDKWRQYAATKPWPARLIYEREHRTLLAFERKAAREFDATLLVSGPECDLFRSLAPECGDRVHAVPNGIDTAYFDPDADYANPYPGEGPRLVFTGAMDYWPNVEAVRWFALEVFPGLRRRWPTLSFAVVGHHPVPAVRRLAAAPGIVVTGRVADVRPYLRHADAVVAPLRIARGTQNKVLEGMAMARPVIATPEAAQGIAAAAGRELLVAAGAADFGAAVAAALAGEHAGLGIRARQRVVKDCRWKFDALDRIMAGTEPPFRAGEARAARVPQG